MAAEGRTLFLMVSQRLPGPAEGRRAVLPPCLCADRRSVFGGHGTAGTARACRARPPPGQSPARRAPDPAPRSGAAPRLASLSRKCHDSPPDRPLTRFRPPRSPKPNAPAITLRYQHASLPCILGNQAAEKPFHEKAARIIPKRTSGTTFSLVGRLGIEPRTGGL